MPQSAILWLQCLGLSSAESAATLEAAGDVPGGPFFYGLMAQNYDL